ncbi:GNAT family N-acetyltransferase [Nocardia sp.]|uniref:GNAT family N-acetyltransferase n=1 Tax=Nocardia sp. TaxID=1821 RepID=UPI0026060C70|nr:GNAT family N-acetyltransferase [Nocardia sp.]
MQAPTVRPIADDDLTAVAELRWHWGSEKQSVPAVGHDEFVRQFTGWARQHRASHRGLVLVHDNVLIGMAWLAVVPRMPSVRMVHRASGDVQCVYVTPGHRNRGFGGRLLDAVLRLAEELELERVTVHSSRRAVTLYGRYGFAASARLLEVDTA